MTVALHPPIDDLARVLSRAALYRGLDLRDDRQALAVLRDAFPHADVIPGLPLALDEARSKAAQNARFFSAADSTVEAVGFGLWIVLFAVAWIILAAPPAEAATALPPHPGLLQQVIPVGVVILIGWLLFRSCLSAKPPVVLPVEDDADRWNGEGR